MTWNIPGWTMTLSCCQPHNLQLSWFTTQTMPVPYIISFFEELALRMMGTPESVTAYNIKMMEMSLSVNVLWVTCAAKIGFQASPPADIYTFTRCIKLHTIRTLCSNTVHRCMKSHLYMPYVLWFVHTNSHMNRALSWPCSCSRQGPVMPLDGPLTLVT